MNINIRGMVVINKSSFCLDAVINSQCKKASKQKAFVQRCQHWQRSHCTGRYLKGYLSIFSPRNVSGLAQMVCEHSDKDSGGGIINLYSNDHVLHQELGIV